MKKNKYSPDFTIYNKVSKVKEVTVIDSLKSMAESAENSFKEEVTVREKIKSIPEVIIETIKYADFLNIIPDRMYKNVIRTNNTVRNICIAKDQLTEALKETYRIYSDLEAYKIDLENKNKRLTEDEKQFRLVYGNEDNLIDNNVIIEKIEKYLLMKKLEKKYPEKDIKIKKVKI